MGGTVVPEGGKEEATVPERGPVAGGQFQSVPDPRFGSGLIEVSRRQSGPEELGHAYESDRPGGRSTDYD
jgi:hypothetical protein